MSAHARDDRSATLDVRLVPISAGQIQAFESLERALSVLAADFWRDYGIEHDEHIAGGLYRLRSALEIVVELWRESSEDPAAVERQRWALEEIVRNGLNRQDARALAEQALRGETG
jgi:hypothetical protein